MTKTITIFGTELKQLTDFVGRQDLDRLAAFLEQVQRDFDQDLLEPDQQLIYNDLAAQLAEEREPYKGLNYAEAADMDVVIIDFLFCSDSLKPISEPLDWPKWERKLLDHQSKELAGEETRLWSYLTGGRRWQVEEADTSQMINRRLEAVGEAYSFLWLDEVKQLNSSLVGGLDFFTDAALARPPLTGIMRDLQAAFDELEKEELDGFFLFSQDDDENA